MAVRDGRLAVLRNAGDDGDHDHAADADVGKFGDEDREHESDPPLCGPCCGRGGLSGREDAAASALG